MRRSDQIAREITHGLLFTFSHHLQPRRFGLRWVLDANLCRQHQGELERGLIVRRPGEFNAFPGDHPKLGGPPL